MERMLDIENIGRIGLMFIDGDLLKDVLIDPFTCDEDDTNYDIPAFNSLKKALMKTERMNPDMFLRGVIWQWYPENRRMASPAVGVTAVPGNAQSWMITDCSPALSEAMTEDRDVTVDHGDGRRTCYFPIKTSAGDVVGALELTEGTKPGLFETIYR